MLRFAIISFILIQLANASLVVVVGRGTGKEEQQCDSLSTRDETRAIVYTCPT
jgi:hypothetical protein